MNILIVDDQQSDYSKFSEKLLQDYPGYRIEYAKDAIEGIKLLNDRCFDILVLDQFMGSPGKNGTDLLRGMKGMKSQDWPEIIFVTANYKEMPAEEIISQNIPIALFIEKDPFFFDMLYRGVLLVIKRKTGGTQYHPNDLFGEAFIDLIIDEANIAIASADFPGYVSQSQKIQIVTLIRSYMGSLRMRSEWDEEDVLELSIFFAEGLCKIFNIPENLIEILRKFLNIEEILYTIPHYRDHFFHQLKVFFLGFCIISKLNREKLLLNTILKEDTGIKTWFITSLFHDIGYPFEKMNVWLNSFIEGVLKSPEEKIEDTFQIPIHFHWGALFGKKYHWFHLEKIISNVCDTYGTKSSSHYAELISDVASFVSEKPDHGIFSSLIIQNFLRKDLTVEEIGPISVAIALHNGAISDLIRQLLDQPFSFGKDPLSFLLAYCDMAQDWGRIRPSIDKSKGYSKFGFPIFTNSRIFDFEKKKVNVDLCYTKYFSAREKKDWHNTVFTKHITPMRGNWSSMRSEHPFINFSITYFFKDGDKNVRLDSLEL
ncbi:MAG: response regulator [Desulfobacteraceae bacterium]|nr:response regulator [Desulfobacteraceae bacterium]MBC2756280.1 response regulator [Desulfobacteraceae bacterium]